MLYHLLQSLIIFFVVLVASHVAVDPEIYFKSVLPSTPMPKAFKDSLPCETCKGYATLVMVAASLNKSTPYVKYNDVASDAISMAMKMPSVSKLNNPPYLKYNGDAFDEIDIIMALKMLSVSKLNNHPYVNYNNVASDAIITAMKMSSIYFLEKDIRAGKSMKLHISKDATTTTPFVPRQVADSLPFSSKKLNDIYNEFKVTPDSLEANLIKRTINDCEKASNEEQDEYCATSLESMVDFAASKVGKKVKVISTQVNGNENTPLHGYKIKDVKKLNGDDVLVCHREFYAYAIHYCHKASKINAYIVTLIGENNLRAKAISICHKDTASWNPKHIAFQVLNINPGTHSVCHFLIENEVAWVPY